MGLSFEPRWFRGLSVYQDVVLDGQKVLSGARDCPQRWEAIEPQLPAAGSILDVGSNFGWFGLKICQSRPECVVASVEADSRSAWVQRRVLQSHRAERICLLTDRAGVRLAERFCRAGQRFDAVLCLSVLHWIADHRQFLSRLATIAGRLLIEQPDPREEGAGVERIRGEIGATGDYLSSLFADRTVTCLARWPSHRDLRYTRELWLVGQPPGWPSVASPGLDVAAMLDLGLSWPPRSWWRQRLPQALPADSRGRLLLTPRGLGLDERPAGDQLARLPGKLHRVPENRLYTPARWLFHRLRRLAGRILRGRRRHISADP
jgi:hypothetical protein